jgi:hypothetical protein
MNFAVTTRIASGPRRREGFALVVVLSMMILLSLLVVGLLSLSSLSLRSSSQGQAQATARANAKLALMMAVGDLQKMAGPDQRVSARAEIRSGANPEKRFWTGFWDTKDWDPTDPDKRTFLGWGVSNPDSQATPAESDVDSPLAGSNLVTLVGEGSVSEPEEQVRVPFVPLSENGTLSGSFAYWVSDEASKASFAVPVEENPPAWSEGSTLGVPRRTAVEALDEGLFSNYVEFMQSKPAAGNAASYGTLDLIADGGTGKTSSRYFHDLTKRSVSLLTNTRDGGIKSDLSTAFELELAEFSALEEFHNSGELNNTKNYDTLDRRTYGRNPEFYPSGHKLGYLFEIPYQGAVVRGPTWDLLRNHYRLYKRDWENLDWSRKFAVSDNDTIASRGTLPMSYSTTNGEVVDRFSRRANPGGIYGNSLRDATYASYKDLAEKVTRGAFSPDTGTTRATAERIMPMVVRATMVIGLRKKKTGNPPPNDWRLAISFDPYVTIVNPFNRAIEFESIGMYSAKFNPLRFRFEYTDDLTGKPTTLDDLQFSHNTGTNGSIAYRLLPTKGKPHRLEPGEVRVLTPEKSGTGGEITVLGKNFAEATFNYGEDSGLHIFPGRYRFGDDPLPIVPFIKPKKGTTIKLKMTGRYAGSFAAQEGDCMIFTQHYSKDHGGRSVKLDTYLPPYMQANFDVFDDPLITRVLYATYDGKTNVNNLDQHPLFSQVSINESGIPDVGEAGLYVGVLDIRMKHGAEDAPAFHQFNPRGQVFDPRNYDGSDSVGPAWKVELRRITDVSELQLVADPQGHGFWGSGMDAASGTSKVVLFDLPRAPLTSLGSLSQADIAVLPSSGASLIGNSFTTPGLASLTSLAGRRSLISTFTTKAPQVQADFSWAANDAIWDQYFFSGINWGNSSLAYESGAQEYTSQSEAITALTGGVSSALANPRIRYHAKPGESSPEDDLKDYSKIANYLTILGGFNVNSTSVEAWRSVLSGLRSEKVKYLSDSGKVRTATTSVPFSRFLLPAGDVNDEWSGFRDLSDDDIEKLAEAMVDQVQARGPFMGLSDFVNRRLSNESKNGAEVGKLGALQMAIESAGLNDSVGSPVGIGNMENTSIRTGDGTFRVKNMTGSPAYLMQADVLTSIGSILRTRSDTFVVRGYGDAKDPSGKIQARAWCEATIQRVPEWLEETDEAPKKLDPRYPNLGSKTIVDRWVDNGDFPEANLAFGRRMKIVSFRWLSADEV